MSRSRATRDIVGKRYGKLVALEPTNKITKQRSTIWKCRCDCGKVVEVSRHSLTTGNTTSCGCSRNAYKLAPGMAAANALYRQYRTSAERRGYSFEIDLETFLSITKQRCYYCGAKPSMRKEFSSYNGAYIYNGVDRVDNSKGYVPGNVVPACKTCNALKNGVTMNIAEKMVAFKKGKRP